MILKAEINKSVKDGSVTIDGKLITDYSERELDLARRKVANYIRRNNLNTEDLAYIFKSLALGCGKYSDDYKSIELTL